MDGIPSVPMRDHCANVTDPRRANARHRVLDMFISAIGAVRCGAEGWEDSAAYGQAQAEWCAQLLDLPHGMPSHDPLRRGRARLDPDACPPCVLPWTQALRARSAGESGAMDGTTLRRSFARAASKAAIPMVSAWAKTHRLVFGQRKVEDQAHAITAMPQL